MSETLPDECSLEFNLFGDLLDDIDSENAIIQKKEARKEEFEALLKFIGGFENWPLLNKDCRREVVKYLDYKSRCQLGLCSKADYETVDKTSIYVYSVEIQDNERSHYLFNEEEFDNVVVRVQFHHDYNTGKRIELVFSQLGDDTLIQWLQYIPKQCPGTRQVIRKSCNYYEEAVKFAEKWMKKGNFELNEIKIEMAKYPFATSQIKYLPRCNKVRIGADDVDSFNWWLRKIPEQLVDLQLILHSKEREDFTLPSDFLNAPQVTQASRFYFWCRAAFTDEQFLKLKAKSISFDCVDVSDDGINQFIKNWVNGKGIDGFQEAHLCSTGNRDPVELIRGLEVRQWDDSFEEEACGFVDDFSRCCGRGQCFQIKSRIDPFESLTLSIHSDRVSIYATGKRMEYRGETYTHYSIP
ncbi:hypothetical protein CAEBREN_32750 [Caenorhabditis brenneri]|uniref:Uncharacterized protein n=1 Tax=Caenorhabditis brenneri TaxID=135651 RepID=G0MGI0_CAEBE|nr:hypothetical protein CAEBREN_32750 [Caenorhabditis brenneri]